MLIAGHPFSREYLTSLKRADIQKLCKDYGVRANMKTEALIELLLDSFQSNMSPLVGPSRIQQPQAPRRVSTRSSTRVSSLRSSGTSGSSSSTSLAASSNTIAVGSPRESKSKLTQYKLGVGRPSAPAVTNLRTTSRSSSSSKGVRGRGGRSFRPPQATIMEEPETSQSAHIEDQAANPDPNPSRVSSTATDNNDVAVRLGRLESTFREANIKRQLASLTSLPSQVAYLKASVQQREAEITGLRGELNVCKAEVLTLRSEVSKLPILEDQLKAVKDILEQLKAASSSTNLSKGKTTRRVPTPFAESNVNLSPSKANAVHHTLATTLTTQGGENPPSHSKSSLVPSEIALGKRPCDTITAAAEGNPSRQEDPRPTIPERKRPRIGAERRPLREKVVEPKHEPEKPAAAAQEGGEGCVGSAGSSVSGPSTQPSVSTPPPTASAPEHVGEVITAPQGELRSEDMSMIDFCHAASSTPRDDIFNFFDDGESFSQLSVTKLGTRLVAVAESNGPTHDNGPAHSSPRHVPDEPRRISSTVARPRTPPRPSGPGRFRVSVDNLSPVHEDMGSPFDPYADGMFSLPFGANLNATPAYGGREAPNQNQNHGAMPAPMPLTLGFGFGPGGAAMQYDDSPVRPAPRTMYGTELSNDTRFGDFGRDGVASSSNMQYW